MIHANRPELQPERIDRLSLDEIGIWIDSCSSTRTRATFSPRSKP